MPTFDVLVRGERRGDLLGAEPDPSPGRPQRPAVQRLQVRARGPGHHGESAKRLYLQVPGSFRSSVSAGPGLVQIESTRVYLHLASDWLAGEYRHPAALIDADATAVSEMRDDAKAAGPVINR
jgi:hypothetical protein